MGRQEKAVCTEINTNHKDPTLDIDRIEASILDAADALDAEGSGSAEDRLSDFRELHRSFKKEYDHLLLVKKELDKAFTEFNQIRTSMDPQEIKTTLTSLTIGQRKHFVQLLDLYTQKRDWIDSYEIARALRLHRSTVQRYLSGEYEWRGSRKITQICDKRKEKNGRVKYKPSGFFGALTKLHAAFCIAYLFLIESETKIQKFYILAASHSGEYLEWSRKRLSLSDSFSNGKKALSKLAEIFDTVDERLDLTDDTIGTKNIKTLKKLQLKARKALGFLLDDPSNVVLSSLERNRLQQSLKGTTHRGELYNLMVTTQRILVLKYNLEKISRTRIGNDFMALCGGIAFVPDNYDCLVGHKKLMDDWLGTVIPEIDYFVFSAQYGEATRKAIYENEGVYPLRALKRIQYTRMKKGEITEEAYRERSNDIDSRIERIIEDEKEKLARMVDRSKSDI